MFTTVFPFPPTETDNKKKTFFNEMKPLALFGLIPSRHFQFNLITFIFFSSPSLRLSQFWEKDSCRLLLVS